MTLHRGYFLKRKTMFMFMFLSFMVAVFNGLIANGIEEKHVVWEKTCDQPYATKDGVFTKCHGEPEAMEIGDHEGLLKIILANVIPYVSCKKTVSSIYKSYRVKCEVSDKWPLQGKPPATRHPTVQNEES